MQVLLACVAFALTAATTGSTVISGSAAKSYSPKRTLMVRYPSGVEVSLGNELTPTQVKDQPCVSYPADSDCFYTLVFLGRLFGDGNFKKLVAQTGKKIFVDPVDCDNTEPEYREYLQWLVGNIPGDRLEQGEDLAQYIGSAPPLPSGVHRYTYLLYKQPGKLHFDEKRLNNSSILGRDKYCVNDLSKKYGLGMPVRGNYYVAKYDDYVPVFYKNMNAEYVLNLTPADLIAAKKTNETQG